MPIQRCPHCQAPLLDEEAIAPACPMCGEALQAPPPPVAVAPPPPPAVRRPWGLILAVGVLAATAVGMWATRPLLVLPPPLEETPAYVALLEQKKRIELEALAAPKQASALRAALEKKLDQQGAELATEQRKREAAETKLAETLVKLATAEKRAADAEAVADSTLRLDKPREQHRIESVIAGETLILAGHVATLRVGSVDGGATLDARALRTRVIVFEQGIAGKSKVLLRSPGGSVTMGNIDGGSVVEIDAPSGVVTVRGIAGDSKVKVRAKQAQFHGPILGAATKVAVTLTTGGAINFTQIQGGRLSWKKENASDPMPRIGKGSIRAPGEFVEGE